MAMTWVLCGAGRRVGKTTLARKLCEILPNAVYAKQGCGTKKPTKSSNFFRSEAALKAFIDACPADTEHIVLESNEQAHHGAADLIIFIDGIPGVTDYRHDVDILAGKSHLQVNSKVGDRQWLEVLRSKLDREELCVSVCLVLREQQQFQREHHQPSRWVEPLRISTSSGTAVVDPSAVVVEQVLTIMVAGVGNFAVMCTPCDVEAMAIGFAYSEGLISSIDDVVQCVSHPDRQTVALQLDDPVPTGGGRNLIVTSSCGMCGSRNIERLMSGEQACPNTLHLEPALLKKIVSEMHTRQGLFSRTGGTHAAGIFNSTGAVIALAEDIGRHNALDKAIGNCLRRNLPLVGCGAVMSGRVSLELVAKAARAGLEIIAAVSAPSTMAIDAAERCNITLCCFVRGERATVYTHPSRIKYRA